MRTTAPMVAQWMGVGKMVEDDATIGEVFSTVEEMGGMSNVRDPESMIMWDQSLSIHLDLRKRTRSSILRWIHEQPERTAIIQDTSLKGTAALHMVFLQPDLASLGPWTQALQGGGGTMMVHVELGLGAIFAIPIPLLLVPDERAEEDDE